MMSVMRMSKRKRMFNKVWHLKKGGDNYCVDEGNDTFDKDGTADEGEEEEDSHDNAYFCCAFFVDVNIWK